MTFEQSSSRPAHITTTTKSFLPFAMPDIGEAEINAVTEALVSGWITTGPKTKQFEREFAASIGVKHAIAVNSCTAAMHLALEVIGLGPGDEVITTPYTFAATSEVIRYFGARPVFVDVDPLTLNMDARLIPMAVTERTKAILPVHMAGLPAEMAAIQECAQRYHLHLIEDAAHAFPATYRGRMVGTIGGLTCFSFYATKTITTGEGGMICTDNDEWAERCRVMSLHGISKDAWMRYTATGSWYYEIIAPGYKYNMTDIAAAVGLAQLRKAETMRVRREDIASRYDQAFGLLPEVQIPSNQAECQHSWHLYMLRLNSDRLRIDRAQFIEELKKRSIGASVHFIPLHIHPYYRKTYGYQPGDFPVAYQEYLREISLPIYSKMSDEQVDDVISAVQEIVSLSRA
jgi:dTDP-4-amino-4,6-dideoxygalactose transaminase